MSAKKTTKKVAKKATKKVAKKATGKKEEPYASAAYDPTKSRALVLKKRPGADNTAVWDRMQANVTKAVSTLVGRSKSRPVSFMSVAQMQKTMVDFDDLYVQNALGATGLRTPTVIEVIAPEASGKTTWAYSMIGHLADLRCYSIYIGCEGKSMDPSHVQRLLGGNRAEANRKLNMLSQWTATQLIECDEVITKTVEETRKRCDADPETKGHPIWVFIDTWSSLMSSAEAAGRSDWGLPENAKKATAKDSGTTTNMGHAKHAQAMKRWLPHFMEKNNCSLVFLNHQNVKVEMGMRRGPVITPSESLNDTTIGGRALKSIAAYRMTMIPEKDIKNADNVPIGKRIKVTFVKNSYGPPRRSYKFDIIFDPREWCDTPLTYDRVVRYDDTTAEWMVAEGLLGTTVNKRRYTCDSLDCVAVKPKALYEALQARPDQQAFLGAALHIDGYEGANMSVVVDGIAAGERQVEIDDVADKEGEEDGDEA